MAQMTALADLEQDPLVLSIAAKLEVADRSVELGPFDREAPEVGGQLLESVDTAFGFLVGLDHPYQIALGELAAVPHRHGSTLELARIDVAPQERTIAALSASPVQADTGQLAIVFVEHVDPCVGWGSGFIDLRRNHRLALQTRATSHTIAGGSTATSQNAAHVHLRCDLGALRTHEAPVMGARLAIRCDRFVFRSHQSARVRPDGRSAFEIHKSRVWLAHESGSFPTSARIYSDPADLPDLPGMANELVKPPPAYLRELETIETDVEATHYGEENLEKNSLTTSAIES
ncbi:hypothetical protein ACNOYE_12645 [Nannocystaceae bacterium ST9]